MMKMEDSHPGITQYFEKGIISIRRTTKSFSRIPIDLTLEQTINAGAASSSQGNWVVILDKFIFHYPVYSAGVVYISPNLFLPGKGGL